MAIKSFRTFFPAAFVVFLCGAAALAGNLELEVRLVGDDGKTGKWDPATPLHFGEQTVNAPLFKATISDGQAFPLLGMFLVAGEEGKVVPLSPGMTVEGKTLTINAEPFNHALRSISGLCWDAGRLAVAERQSFDGNDNYVYLMSGAGQLIERIETVAHPRAIAAGKGIVYVLGDGELAAIDTAHHKRLWLKAVEFAEHVGQIALVKDRLYLGDKSQNAIRILDATTGQDLGQWSGEGKEKLATTEGLSGIGVAATSTGNLIVSDSSSIREFAPDGKFVRHIADVAGGWRAAVGPGGEVAVAVPCGMADVPHVPQVYKFSAVGELLTRYVLATWGGPRPKPTDTYKVRYFGGLTGTQLATGGLTFDDAGNLYLGDYAISARSPTQFWFANSDMDHDGGIIKYSPDDETRVRLGSRFGPDFIKSRLAARMARRPLQRLQVSLAGQHRASIISWGDSISAVQTDTKWYGGASTPEKNWVNVLGSLLKEKYPKAKITTLPMGIGGQNAAEGLARDPAATACRYDLMFLQFGTNDTAFQHVTPREYGQTLREMVTSLYVRTDADVVIVTAGPLKERPPYLFRERPEEYVSAAEAVGKELNVPVVNMNEAMIRRLAGRAYETLHRDPTDPHPNDEGHRAWAEIVLEKLSPNLPTTSASK